LEVIALTEQGRVIPLTTRLSLYAADMALQHRLSFTDAIIYASSRQFDVPLITADDHFKDLPEVIFFSKKSGSLINPQYKNISRSVIIYSARIMRFLLQPIQQRGRFMAIYGLLI
jgi:hypothetical protein